MDIITNMQKKIKSSSLIQRILNAVIYGIGGSIGSRMLMMLSGIIISRFLGKEHYGQFSMINSTVTLFVTFSGVGIAATLTRYVSLYRSKPEKLGNIIGTLSTFVGLMSIVMAILVFLFSDYLSRIVSDSSILTNYFKITSITIFFAALASIQQSILLGMEKYKKSARIELIRCAVYLVIAGILTILFGVYGAIWALFISQFIRFYLMYLENKAEYKKNNIKVEFKYNSEIKKIIYHFTIPGFIASLFVMPVNWINNSILTRSVGFGELAIFSVALQWMTIITYIPSQMGQVKPIYTDLFSQKDFKKLKKIFLNITATSIILVVPIVLFGIVFGKHILNFYGQGYESGYLTFVLLMVTAFLITLQSQVGAILESIGKMWIGFMLNFVWSILIIFVFYYFRNYGSVGYAIAYCVAYGVHNVLSYIMIYHMWKRRGQL